ncbi:MAG: sulfatase [Isosphaeraceae bacterium]
MRRRLALLLACVFGIGIDGPARGDDGLVRRPNIVLLLLDDQDAYSPMWEAMPVAASLARDRGLTFGNAFAPTPICTPARVTLISGKLAHNTGVYTIAGPTGGWRYPANSTQSFATVLDNLGYTNALIGKGWGFVGLPPGFDYSCILHGDRMYEGYGYDVAEQHRGGAGGSYSPGSYVTDFLADRAAAFLRDQGRSDQPFFLYVAPTAPHLPLDPAPRHQAYANKRWKNAIPKKPNFNERDVSDKSDWLRTSAAVRSAAVPYAQGEFARRMGCLMAVDEMVARIRNILVAQGKWDRTVLIITSDNGYNLGSHRLIHKMAPYEESVRVPLVIAGGGIPRGEIDRIVGLHDIGPTLITLAGSGAWPIYMDGKSLMPFLRQGSDEDIPWRDALALEYNGGGVHPGYNPGGPMGPGYSMDIPTYRAIRTDTEKYIRYASGEEELYDLRSDPFELNNRLTNKRDRAVLARRDALKARLQLLLRSSGPENP